MAIGFLCFCLAVITSPSNLWCQNINIAKIGAFEYPPFYWEEDGAIKGIGVDILKELFGRLKIKTEVDIYPLKRALGYAKDGKIDAIMILIQTPERSEYLYYTIPVMSVRGVMWSAADRQGGPVNFSRLEDLKQYKIGATIGYSYGEKLDNILKTMGADLAATDYQNYKKLMAHRIDIFPGNEIVAKGLFKMNPELKGKFHHSNQAFLEWMLHMGISKKSALARAIPNINSILQDLKKTEFIGDVVKKYTE